MEKRNLNKYIKYPHFTNHHVGAYCIRPENIRVDTLAHSGVCDTPLHGMFEDIQFIFYLLGRLGMMFYFYLCKTNLIDWL